MVIILGLMQFLLIAVILLYEFHNKSSSMFLWATLMLMFGMPHLLTSFTGDYKYNNTVISWASVFVIVFGLLYLGVRIIIGKNIQKTNRDYFMYENLKSLVAEDNSKHSTLTIVLVIVVILKLYPFIKSSGGLLATSWGLGRAYTSGLSYFNSYQITSVAFYALAGIIVFFWVKKEYKLFVLSLVIYLATVIVTRNRMEVLPFLCAIITIPIYKNKKISISIVVAGFIATIFVVYLTYGLWVFRHYGSISNFINSFNLQDFVDKINNHLRTDTDNGELNYRKWFYYFIQNDNNFDNFNRGHSYIRMLLVYLPTQFSGGIKPPDFAQSMGTAIGMSAGGSMHPTLFGDCYANLNVFGVLLGIFWALYATLADKLTINQAPLEAILIYILNSISFVIIGRGSVYNGFIPVAYGIPLILLFSYLRNHIHIRFVFKR